MSLNTAQREVVETPSGPLLVLAGAGTGKTRVVTYRVARLIDRGTAPERILAVTFTNKAAREMQERIGKKLGGRTETKPEILTFHSLCVRVLRRQIHRLGFPNLFSIYDRGDQESLARQILREIKTSGGTIRPGDLVSRISRWKSAGVRADDALNFLGDDPHDYIMAVAYKRYQRKLQTLGAVDFDDLLLHTEELFERFPDVLAAEAGRFDHLLVDEYQDTNLSQYRIIRGLAIGHRNLCVVGDDDQAIYGWRGAEVTHILNFQKDWPDAKVVRLEVNYRSTEPIISWANRVIAFNRQRHAKTLRTFVQGEAPVIQAFEDGEEEAKAIVAHIKRRIAATERTPRDFAILFRTNEQPRAFELQLREQKIPYTLLGGQSFFDRKEVKDVIAYLKTVLRPKDDVSLRRILNTPPRGIGETTIRRLVERTAEGKKSLWEVLSDDGSLGGIDSKSREAIDGFRRLIRTNAGRFRAKFSPEAVSELVEQSGYRREIDRLYPDDSERASRWEAVGEVVSAAAAYLKGNIGGDLRGFLDSTALGGSDFSSSNDRKLDANAVALMTYHAAKGLEFKEVYMVGMEEGILPHRKSLEDMGETAIAEERRLCYVGITRAQHRLIFSWAKARLKWGKMWPTLPSRFLFEATGQADNPIYLKIKAGKSSDAERKASSGASSGRRTDSAEVTKKPPIQSTNSSRPPQSKPQNEKMLPTKKKRK